MFLILILNIMNASTFVIAKSLLNYSEPFFIIGFRMIIAGLILIAYNFFNQKNEFKITKSDYKLFALLSLIHIYIPFSFEFWSLKYITAAKTAMIYNLSPFITAILVYLLFKERLTTKKIIGLTIGFLGFVPVLITYMPQELMYGEAFFISVPEFCLLIAVASSAYSWIVIQRKNVPLILLNGMSMIGGGVLSLLTSLIFETWNPVPIYNLNYFLFLVILLMIIGNFICYNLYAVLLKRYTATFLSFAGFTIPLFTALLQFIFFGTTIGLDFIVTTILVFAGLFIFYQEELKHGIIKTS